MKVMSLKLEDELKEEITTRARKEDRTEASLIRIAIRRYLNEVNDE